MLTFEKVLDVFKDYLTEDDMFEIVMASRGYVLLGWDRISKQYSEVQFCPTPEHMLEVLLGAFDNYTEYNLTHGRRDLTEADEAEIRAKRQAMADRCK